MSEPITGTDSESVYTTGELYVWSYLHQVRLPNFSLHLHLRLSLLPSYELSLRPRAPLPLTLVHDTLASNRTALPNPPRATSLVPTTSYQAVLCRPSCLKPFHNVSEFYAAVLAHPRTKEVLNGTSPMGELKQYIITLEAAKARAPSRSSAGSVMGMDLSGLGEPRMLLSVGLGLAIGMTAAHLLPCAAGGKAR